MADLEYKIGELEIDADKLVNLEGKPFKAAHRFAVTAVDNVVSIYVAEARQPLEVTKHFGVSENMVGGGCLYTNSDVSLVLDGSSRQKGSIPEYAAQEFAELIRPKLEEQGADIKGIAVNPSSRFVSSYWP